MQFTYLINVLVTLIPVNIRDTRVQREKLLFILSTERDGIDKWKLEFNRGEMKYLNDAIKV